MLHTIFFAPNYYEIFTPVLQTRNDSAERMQPIMNAICYNHNLFPHPGNPESYQYMCNCPVSSFYSYIYLLLCCSAIACWQTRQAVHLRGGSIKQSPGPGAHGSA